MISAIAVASATCCFAVSYLAHQVLPVKPINRSDIVSKQSTSGTINLLSKEELTRQAKTPKEFVDFYLNKQATLENVAESITHTNDIRSAYNVIVEKATSDDTGYFELLKKSLEEQYTFLKQGVNPNISVLITRSDTKQEPVQSQVVPSL